jgi:hypothetical protein
MENTVKKWGVIIFSALLFPQLSQAQFVHKIKADSVRIYNDNCNAEFIVENSTKNIAGFLFNRGNGRTEFRKAVVKLSDTSFLIGADTLVVKNVFSSLTAGSVLFFDGTRISEDNNNLYWDQVNHRLGIGTTTPAMQLDIPAYSENSPQLRIGGLEFQSFFHNNAWFGDNAYYSLDEGAFKYRSDGPAGLFYFAGNEGQFRFMPYGSAGELWTGDYNNGYTQVKINASGSVALGGKMNYLQGDFNRSGIIIREDSVIIGLTTSTTALNRLSVKGFLTASGYRTTSGTSSMFLKADGSTDNNSYATVASLSNYLPLSGGTITGSTIISSGINQPLKLSTSSNGPWSLELHRSDIGAGSRVYNDNGSRWYFEHRPSFAGNTPLDAANYNSYAPTLTGGNASGTWPISITGNASYASSAGSVAWSNVSGRPTALSQFTNDLVGYGNWQPLENQRLSTSNSPTFSSVYIGSGHIQWANEQWDWSTNAHQRQPNSIKLYDQYSSLGGTGNPTSYGTILDIYGRSSHLHSQWYMGESGQLLYRSAFYGTDTWNSWQTLLTSSNYNSYSPTLTGGNASGTWPISITGNASYASSAGSVAWSNVSGRPTALSQFTNDLAGYGNWQPLENQRLSTSNSPTFNNVYTNAWFRNNALEHGLYNEAAATHFYASSSHYWNMATSGSGSGGLILRNNHGGDIKGYYYWNSEGVGLLNNTGNWGLRINYGSANPGGQLYGTWSGTITNAQRADRANGNFYVDDNYGNSIIGVYSSYRYQGVFAMGSSYKLPDDGTTPGNLYGIAWTHDNVGGQSKSGLGHQMLVMSNGVTQTALGTGIWTNGNIVTTSYGNAAQWNNKAQPRSEGPNYIDYARYVYNNGAYYGSAAWVEPSELGVRYAANAGSANNTNYLGGHYYDTYIGKFGNSYYQANTWLQFNGTYGLYWPNHGIGGYSSTPHLYPNYVGSYGAMAISGARGGYSGFVLNDGGGVVTGMYDGDGNGGAYDPSSGWHFYWHRSNGSLGIGGSTTAAGYKMYVNGASYFSGYSVQSGYHHALATPSSYSSTPTIKGEATGSTDNIGVMGVGSYGSNYNVGVHGDALYAAVTGIGVYGRASAGYSTNYGIYGTAGGGGYNYAGYFDGVVYSSSYFTTSDRRVKKDIINEEAMRTKIKQLRPVTYTYDKGARSLNLPTEKQHGFVAQELQEVFPESVRLIQNPIFDGTKFKGVEEVLGINYQSLIPLLVKTLQEQDDLIEDLRKRLELLEKRKIN